MNRKALLLGLAMFIGAGAASAGNIIPKGTLGVGRLADSPNGAYHLDLNKWGDVVITDNANKAVWYADSSTGIVGQMKGDGCKHDGWKMYVGAGFSVEDRAKCFKYSTKVDSGLPPNADAYTDIVLQDDSNLVAYMQNVRWKSSAYGAAAPGVTQSVIIPPGTVMPLGTTYRNGNYLLAFQTDGNFVVYNGNTPIFNAEINGKGGVKAQMQYDGNFVIYNANNVPVWHTHTEGNANAYMAFQPDGHLLIVKIDVIWARFGHPSTYWAPGKVGTPVNVPLGWLVPTKLNDLMFW